MPGPATTDTDPPARLAAPLIRSGGATVIPATCMPAGMASVTVTGALTGKLPASTQLPAGTDRARPPTSKENDVPRVTPRPATLHTLTWLVCSPLVKVTVASCVRFPPTTCTWAVPPGMSVPTRREAGEVATLVTRVPGCGTSVTVTTPSGTRRTPEQLPTGTSTRCCAAVKVKAPVTFVASDLLQIWMKPSMTASLVKVTWFTTGPMDTATVPSAMLGVPTRRLGGLTVMSVTRVVGSNTSATVTMEVKGNEPAEVHWPAGTATMRPATTKVKFVPGTMPAPAVLQSVRVPISERLVNVTSVWEAIPPATTRTWADRVGSDVPSSRSSGATVMAATPTPATGSSVTVTGPTGSWRGAEQAPTGTATVWVPTVNRKVPETPLPSESLHTSRYPVSGPAAFTRAGATNQASTDAKAVSTSHLTIFKKSTDAPVHDPLELAVSRLRLRSILDPGALERADGRQGMTGAPLPSISDDFSAPLATGRASLKYE